MNPNRVTEFFAGLKEFAHAVKEHPWQSAAVLWMTFLQACGSTTLQPNSAELPTGGSGSTEGSTSPDVGATLTARANYIATQEARLAQLSSPVEENVDYHTQSGEVVGLFDKIVEQQGTIAVIDKISVQDKGTFYGFRIDGENGASRSGLVSGEGDSLRYDMLDQVIFTDGTSILTMPDGRPVFVPDPSNVDNTLFIFEWNAEGKGTAVVSLASYHPGGETAEIDAVPVEPAYAEAGLDENGLPIEPAYEIFSGPWTPEVVKVDQVFDVHGFVVNGNQVPDAIWFNGQWNPLNDEDLKIVGEYVYLGDQLVVIAGNPLPASVLSELRTKMETGGVATGQTEPTPVLTPSFITIREDAPTLNWEAKDAAEAEKNLRRVMFESFAAMELTRVRANAGLAPFLAGKQDKLPQNEGISTIDAGALAEFTRIVTRTDYFAAQGDGVALNLFTPEARAAISQYASWLEQFVANGGQLQIYLPEMDAVDHSDSYQTEPLTDVSLSGPVSFDLSKGVILSFVLGGGPRKDDGFLTTGYSSSGPTEGYKFRVEDGALVIEIRSRFLTQENGDGASALVAAAFEHLSHLGQTGLYSDLENTFSYMTIDHLIKRRSIRDEATQVDVAAGRVFGGGYYFGTGFLEIVRVDDSGN